MLKKLCFIVVISWLAVISSCAGRSESSARPQRLAAPIRSVNFDKLAYANFPHYTIRPKKRLTLSPGEVTPDFLTYGDMTADGIEDAAVAIEIPIRGSAILDYVYIYAMVSGSPKVIWEFETGDRADGGLRNVYSENGQLVIELFGKNRTIGKQLYLGDEPLCCPGSFTKSFYHWNGTSFQRLRSEVLPNPAQDAATVMATYER